ncbi:hypothetical protein SSYM_0716, partial [Serratia symbiotica str. Tucson]
KSGNRIALYEEEQRNYSVLFLLIKGDTVTGV